MKITTKVALEVATHEGLVRQAYKDSKGVLTWSVGITSASGHDVKRYVGQPQTMERCLEVWLWLLERYADDVRKAFSKPLTEEQFAAALDFHWNTGAIKTASWVAHFNSGRIAEAERAFMLWNKPKEIVRRREAGCRLFFDGVWSQDGKITEYTRVSAKMTPVWASAVRRDITAEVTAILGATSLPPDPTIPDDPGMPDTPSRPVVGGPILLTFAAIAGGSAILKWFTDLL